MKFNPKKTIYILRAITSDGTIYNVTNAIESLTWDDGEKEVSRKCLVELFNAKVKKDKWLTNVIGIGTQFILYADIKDGNGEKEILKSTSWTWEYRSAKERILSLTLYENSFYMTQSSGNYYASKGKKTDVLVKEICKKAGIKVRYEYETITHQAIKNQNKKYSDMVLDLIEEVEKQNKTKAVVEMDGDTLVITKRGNKNKYKLSLKNVGEVYHSYDKIGMVTKVLITSSASNADSEPSIVGTKEGNLEYGTIQHIVNQASKDDKKEAEKEAEQILEEKGEPEETIKVDGAPDYPFLRKGEIIQAELEDIVGEFYIIADYHNADNKTMDLELERVKKK